MKKERIIVIYGVRRVGKTSLLRVALNEAKVPFAYIDVRGIYDRSGNVSEILFVKDLIASFKKNMTLYEKVRFNIKDILKHVKGFRFREMEIELISGVKIDLHEVLKRINDWCADHGLRFVIALDEAQYLRYSKYYPLLLSWVFDNLKKITVVLAGSEVGLLQDFLGSSKSGKPLGGRIKFEIRLDRFDYEQGTDFLKKGLQQANVSPRNDELEEAIREFDGIVGWLTMYGHYRASGLPHQESLAKTIEEAEIVVRDELYKLIGNSKERYLSILKAVSQGNKRWMEIKDYVTLKVGPIADSQFNYLLNKLIKYGFAEKDNNEYSITDPILLRIMRK